jgi:hypothetical protein
VFFLLIKLDLCQFPVLSEAYAYWLASLGKTMAETIFMWAVVTLLLWLVWLVHGLVGNHVKSMSLLNERLLRFEEQLDANTIFLGRADDDRLQFIEWYKARHGDETIEEIIENMCGVVTGFRIASVDGMYRITEELENIKVELAEICQGVEQIVDEALDPADIKAE